MPSYLGLEFGVCFLWLFFDLAHTRKDSTAAWNEWQHLHMASILQFDWEMFS